MDKCNYKSGQYDVLNIWIGLDKLVPCANDMSVRQSILKSVADNTDIPPPRAEVTAEEAQRYVCR